MARTWDRRVRVHRAGALLASVTFVCGVTWTSAAPASAAGVDHFEIVAPAVVYHDFPFSVSVTAEDPSGSVVVDYAGTVHFTTTGTVFDQLPGDYAFTPSDAGVHVFSDGVKYRTLGTQTVTVSDAADSAVTGSTSFEVRVDTAPQGWGGSGRTKR